MEWTIDEAEPPTMTLGMLPRYSVFRFEGARAVRIKSGDSADGQTRCADIECGMSLYWNDDKPVELLHQLAPLRLSTQAPGAEEPEEEETEAIAPDMLCPYCREREKVPGNWSCGPCWDIHCGLQEKIDENIEKAKSAPIPPELLCPVCEERATEDTSSDMCVGCFATYQKVKNIFDVRGGPK